MSKGFDIVIGTRPDVIKFAPLILEMEKRKIPFHIYHELQHEDYNMFGSFLKELNIADLIVNSIRDHHVYQNILIYGDTDGAFKQAHECKRDGLKVIHVEAGLRCGDNSMWEEQNRKMIDSISDYWFAPTFTAMSNLTKEKFYIEDRQRIFHTGNLIVDAINLTISQSNLSRSFDSSTRSILITIHRRENIYHKRFKDLIYIIQNLQKKYNVVWPVHPHTFGHWCSNLKEIEWVSPMSYLNFLYAILNADLVITDSGGVVEEACILRKKCIVVRKSTERPETLTRNARMCYEYGELESIVEQMLKTEFSGYDNPYLGEKDKTVAETMCDILESL